ncbi:MAG: CehA/McbA family metallohydrolase [Thermomicrobiales bacterium]|nr:CehA/McbA family metallohydrolase [Thermomicrobiales bacterium]
MPPISGRIPPFNGDSGVWLRCALHAHTTESDGWLSPSMLRRYHAQAGYDVLAITDHDRFTPEPEGNDQLLLIGGTEISLIAPKSGGPLHLLGLGVEQMPDVTTNKSTLAEAADAVRAAGGASFVAHPVWSGLLTDEVAGIERTDGVEVFNSSCDVEQGRAYGDTHWDLWLSQGLRLGGIAADDLHLPGYEAFRSWTMVFARERSRQAVVDALREGSFYATMGPRFEAIELHDDRLEVRSTPVRSITVYANAPYGARVNAGHHELTFHATRLRTADSHVPEGIIAGDLLSGAIFPRGSWPLKFVRVVLEDDRGRRAWSNPVYL